ncbi:MAG TPA: hypothetical protein VK997_05565, partial [Deferrisomatales bacterium]|nr:hypothetical protein [Deferrisomatales bacterium]
TEGGEVRLSWTAPGDPDVVTYQVRRGIEGVRAPVPLPYVRAQGGAGTYLDRVDPRSRFAYTYTVVALDAAGNESPAAGPVRVAVPDIRPPRPPVLTGLTPRAKGVEVAWGLPDEPDLAGVYVYRSEVGESGSGARVTDQPIPLDETRFLDGEVNAGEVYAYRVTVVDGSGNESEPSPARQVRALGGKEVGNGPAR